jgi:hypothetical protein
VLDASTFFVQLASQGLASPASALYLPALILGAENPVLEPYAAGSVDLGEQTIPGLGVQVDVQLQDVEVAGLANVQLAPPGLQVQEGACTFTAQFPAPQPPQGVPSALQLSGGFQVTNSAAGTLTGTFTLTLPQSSLSGTCQVGGTSAADVWVGFSALALQAPTGSVPTVTVQSTGTPAFWLNLIQNLLEQPSVAQQALTAVNAQLAANLGEVGTSLTGALQSALPQLGGA